MTSNYGGLFLEDNQNLRDPGALDYLVEIVSSSMFGSELYPEVYHKAALYMYNVVANHIFNDGNKRTGLEAAILFLDKNNLSVSDDISDDELINFALAVADGELSLD